MFPLSTASFHATAQLIIQSLNTLTHFTVHMYLYFNDVQASQTFTFKES